MIFQLRWSFYQTGILYVCFFFFQAEDGIRDYKVTGVQTCALPISRLRTLFPTTRDPLATLTTLEAALGHRPKFDDVAAALAHAFEREHGLRLRADGLTADETAHAARLVEEKYATAELPACPRAAARHLASRASSAALS